MCFLDNLNKFFEHVIVNRDDHLKIEKVLSNNQYGFKTERSTTDAALKLKKIASAAIKKRTLCTAVSLDTGN